MGIIARGLHKTFNTVPVIQGIDLEMQAGEMVALLGPSGGGKSTLLRMIAGLERLDAGEVWLDGHRVDGLDTAERGVGFVFQHYALFRHMNVADNVAFGLHIRNVPRPEARRRADALLARVGLAGMGDRRPDELSGGQRQRVALARALAPEPKVLLLDEPFGALDARVRADLRAWLRHLHDDVGATTIIVTHDQEEALAIADRVVVIREGKVEQAGTPAEILDAPRTEFVARFVGEVNVLEGTVDRQGSAHVAPFRVPVSESFPCGQRVRAVIRSHEVRLTVDPNSPLWVRRIVPVDDRARLEIAVGEDTLLVRLSRAAIDRLHLQVGTPVSLEATAARVWPLEAP